jgi:hypothetical protein
MIKTFVLIASLLPLAAAQDSELLTRMKAMEDRIKALEAEVQTLKGQPAAPVAPSPPAVAIAAQVSEAPQPAAPSA